MKKVRAFRNYPPNENVLPALLDPEAEKRRLESINDRKEENKKEKQRLYEVKKRTEKIISGEIKNGWSY